MEENKNSQDSKIEKQKKEKESFWINLLLENKLSVALVIVIIIIISIAFSNSISIKKDFKNQINELTTKHNIHIDSLKTDKVLFAVRSFSHGITPELIENSDKSIKSIKEAVKLFASEDIIKDIQIVDVTNAKVMIASNVLNENSLITNVSILRAQEPFIIGNEDYTRIVFPVRKERTRLGILIIDSKF